MALKKELIDMLACPQCKGKLTLTKQQGGLACDKCKVIYPIKDDIPIMLVEQAIPEAEWAR